MGTSADILIVEDRGLVARKVRRELERAGFTVAGMSATQAAAIDLASRLEIGAAVLDIDLQGLPVYPVAAILRRRGIPFLFLTGFGRAAIAEPWADVQVVEKPFEHDTLIRGLRAAMAGEAMGTRQARVSTPAIRDAWDSMRHTRDLLTEHRAWSEERGLRPKLE